MNSKPSQLAAPLAVAFLLAAAPAARTDTPTVEHALALEVLGRGLAGLRYDALLGQHLGASLGLSWVPFTSVCFHCTMEQRRSRLDFPIGLGFYAPAGDSRFYLEPTLSVSAGSLDLHPSLGGGYFRSFSASETFFRIGVNLFLARKDEPETRVDNYYLLPVPGVSFGFIF